METIAIQIVVGIFVCLGIFGIIINAKREVDRETKELDEKMAALKAAIKAPHEIVPDLPFWEKGDTLQYKKKAKGYDYESWRPYHMEDCKFLGVLEGKIQLEVKGELVSLETQEYIFENPKGKKAYNEVKIREVSQKIEGDHYNHTLKELGNLYRKSLTE